VRKRGGWRIGCTRPLLASNCISSLSSRAREIKIVCANLLIFLFKTIGVYSTAKCGVELLYPNNYNSGRQNYDI
jgi:hypothetical protein